jgi:hypothetical protein
VLHLVLELGELGDDLLALRLFLTGIARTHAAVGIVNCLSLTSMASSVDAFEVRIEVGKQ